MTIPIVFGTMSLLIVLIGVPIMLIDYRHQMEAINEVIRSDKLRRLYRPHNLPEWSD